MLVILTWGCNASDVDCFLFYVHVAPVMRIILVTLNYNRIKIWNEITLNWYQRLLRAILTSDEKTQ